MSTRANVVIRHQDRAAGFDNELWFYRQSDGSVHGAGLDIVRIVSEVGEYVDTDDALIRLWDMFLPPFVHVTGLNDDIEFLYRVTFADHAVRIVARHGGYGDPGSAPLHCAAANDTQNNAVELYRMEFANGGVTDVRCDIREPESYISTLRPECQASARSWRGELPGRMPPRAASYLVWQLRACPAISVLIAACVES